MGEAGESTERRAPALLARLTVAPEPASVPKLRRWVLAQLGGTNPDLAETAQLLACELVTNVIRHAGTEARVTLLCEGERVRVEVADANARPAVLADRGTAATGGRGLRIVDALADSWGEEVRADGKTVWFELGGRRSGAGGGASGTVRTAGGGEAGGPGRRLRERLGRRRR